MGQMQQVLGNLVINAYQAMLTPRGPPCFVQSQRVQSAVN